MYKGSVQNLGNSDSRGNYDLVYYTADIINSNSTNTNSINDPQLRFQETRNTPIINNTRDYEFSIVRFQVNGCGKNLPIFIPNILVGVDNFFNNSDFVTSPIDSQLYICISQAGGLTVDPSLDPTHWSLFDYTQPLPSNDSPFLYQNNRVISYKGLWVSGRFYNAVSRSAISYTAYSLGLSVTFPSGRSYYFSRNIIFESESLSYGTANFPFPNLPITSQDVSSDYYYVYTYSHWVNLVNKTLQSIYNTLVLNCSSGGDTLVGFPPFMTYDPTSNLFNIYYDTSLYGTNEIGQQLNSPFMYLYGNDNFYGLFSSFEVRSIPLPIAFTAGGTQSVNRNEPNRFVVKNNLNSNIWIPNTFTGFPTLAPSYYKMAQNFVNTGSMWNPISSIVFTSGQLPVVNETVSAPVKYGSSNTDSSTISNNFTPTIADVAIDIKKADGYSNLIYYEPNGEFRMASMLGGSNGELTNIDIQVFWKNRLDNRLYPLRMFNYSNVSMKMLFRKKK